MNTISVNNNNNLNFSLKHSISNSIRGIVLSQDGTPIKKACIKITDKSLNPIIHCLSNEKGEFFLYNLPYNEVILICKKQNFTTFNSNILYLPNVQNILNITLKEHTDFYSVLGSFKSSCQEYLKYSQVKLTSTTDESLTYKTFCDEHGIYLFKDISLGKYVLSISSMFFQPIYRNITLNENTPLLVIPSIELICLGLKGTISGYIRDIYNIPISNAIVILFKEGSTDPIDFTYTNSNGIYLFCNLNPGNYYIIAK